MSAIKHFIQESILRDELDTFLANELERAGYAGVELARTPLGARIIIYATKPGVVIGRRGTTIRELAKMVEDKFKLSNPQIAVSEIEVPELNARVMASQIADSLQRGLNFRRSGFWAVNQVMKAGALGVEVIIRGKLRTQRHRTEKYKTGYVPTSGDPALTNVRVAVHHVKLKQGLLGITVKIVPPDAVFPDLIKPEFKPELLTNLQIEVSAKESPKVEDKNQEMEPEVTTAEEQKEDDKVANTEESK